jgi:Caspase domain/FG-GAP-like repeat/FG-GAP repeat
LPATAEPRAGSRRALLVATGGYTDPGLAALRAPTGDVDALAAVLADGSIGEFEVSRLVDRPTENLKMEIEAFFGDAKRDDLLLLYFSCHGVLSQSRRFYFATATTALNLLRATAIEDSFVNDVMQHSRARSIVLILDCCHSGAFGKGLTPKSALTVDVEHRFEGRGRVTLSASTALEYAFEEANPATGINELEPAAPGSLFTRCLVEGLATGDADMDGDGSIAVDELYDYVCQRMREDVTHQTPGMAGDVRGEIVIARSPRRVGLPAELRQAVDSRLAGVREGAVTELAELLGSTEPGMAEAARAALERLARDDSQRVSARAREALGPPAPPAPPPPEEPPTTVLPAPEPAPRRGRRFRSPRRGVMLAGAGALAAIAAAVALLTGGYSGPAIAYDFDGDGAQEIAIAPSDAQEVLVHAGPGSDAVTKISTEAADGSAAGLSSADFDGDGHVDLAVGVPPREAVTVFYGTDDGISDERRQRLRAEDFDLPAVAGRYGANILGRDFDDDGYADLVIGAPGDPTAWETGAVQILFGSEEGLRTDNPRLLEQPTNGEISAFGSRLRSGDIDGDGTIDLVEGSPDPDFGETSGHIAFCAGAAGGPTSCTALATDEDDSASSALAVADVTGDGRDDIVQSDVELPSGSGGLRFWLGREGGPLTAPDDVVTPDELALDAGALDDRFGASLDAGLIDDDDYADVVVGAPGHDDAAGAIAVIRGDSDGFATTGHRLLWSDDSAQGDRLGSTLAMLRLKGPEDRPDVVVAAEGVKEFGAAVLVLREGELDALSGLDGADASADSLRLGRTAGP